MVVPPPLTCMWGSTDVCMFGGTCINNTCVCPVGTMKDNMALHIEGCVPEVLLPTMFLMAMLFLACEARVAWILRTRTLKAYMKHAAIWASFAGILGFASAVCAYVQGGFYEGWSIFAAPFLTSGIGVLINTWFAIISPLFISSGRSLQDPIRAGHIAIVYGNIVTMICGCICAAYAHGDRQSFNIAVITYFVVGATNNTIIMVGIGYHANQLAAIIKDSNSKRMNMNMSEHVQLVQVGKRVVMVRQRAIPAAMANFVFALVPLVMYLSTGTGPMVWFFVYIIGPGTAIQVTLILDVLTRPPSSPNHNRAAAAVTLSERASARVMVHQSQE